ncbi:34423_t:CDS:2, partial [Gigaspora margarita]
IAETMENNLPKFSFELRIGSASLEVNEPDVSEKHMPVRFIENEEVKDFEESEVEKSFANIGVDLLKMHETVTNNVIASHNEIAIGIDVMNLILAEQKMDFIPNNPFPFTPGLDHHIYPCHSPP